MSRNLFPRRVLVGEDLVDLAHTARSVETERAFDARAFSMREQRHVDSAIYPAQVRWRLWSAKEATFKAAFKLVPEMRFNPKKFEVSPSVDQRRGEVAHGVLAAQVTWTTCREYVHCVAVVGDAQHVVRSQIEADERFGHSPQLDSMAARELACNLLAGHLYSPFELFHASSGRGPLLIRGAGVDEAHWDLSVSHDGRFVSASVCQTKQASTR